MKKSLRFPTVSFLPQGRNRELLPVRFPPFFTAELFANVPRRSAGISSCDTRSEQGSVFWLHLSPLNAKTGGEYTWARKCC